MSEFNSKLLMNYFEVEDKKEAPHRSSSEEEY